MSVSITRAQSAMAKLAHMHRLLGATESHAAPQLMDQAVARAAVRPRPPLRWAPGATESHKVPVRLGAPRPQ